VVPEKYITSKRERKNLTTPPWMAMREINEDKMPTDH
jgi:hypothetical protein